MSDALNHHIFSKYPAKAMRFAAVPAMDELEAPRYAGKAGYFGSVIRRTAPITVVEYQRRSNMRRFKSRHL